MIGKSMSKGVSKKLMWIGIGLAVLLMLALFSSFFGNQSPNYYRLRRVANDFEAPSNWQFEGNRENRGTLGLWCIQLTGPECPYYSQTYLVNTAAGSNVIEELTSVINEFGIEDIEIDTGRCNETYEQTDTYYCEVSGRMKGVTVSISGSNNRVVEGYLRYAIKYKR